MLPSPFFVLTNCILIIKFVQCDHIFNTNLTKFQTNQQIMRSRLDKILNRNAQEPIQNNR